MSSSTRASRTRAVALGLALVLLCSSVAASTRTTTTTTAEDQIQSVELVTVGDSDGDGDASSFRLEIQADTSFDDTDSSWNDPGEPYFEVEIDGEDVVETDVVARDTEYSTTIDLTEEDLQGLEQGSHEVTVELWDQDDERDDSDLGDDGLASEWTGELDYEPPSDLGIEASRTATVVGSPVSFRTSGENVTWELASAPAGSSATVRGNSERTATLRPDEPGEYTVRVASGSASASVTVTARQSDRLALLRKYAPRIHFHRDATYVPTRYEAFVYNASLENLGDANDDAPTTFALAGKGSNWELDLNGSAEQFPTYDDGYPPSVYGSVHRNVAFRGHTYTAVTYWLFYVFDPKHEEGVSALLSHESDTETLTVLVNESGPQWVAASQHYGGELREWEKTPATGTHPHLYPALGAHSNYLRDTGAYDGSGIFLQEQFVNHTSESTDLFETGLSYRDRTGDATVWSRDGSTGTGYQLAVLTGDEIWATYGGVFGADDDAGKVPMRRTRWTAPGEWLEGVPSDEDQIAGSLTASDWTLTDETVSAEVRVTNTGPKPHPFWAVLEAKPANASWSSDSAVELTSTRLPVGTESSVEATLSASMPTAANRTNAGDEWTVRVRLLAYRPSVSESEDLLAPPVVAPRTLRVGQTTTRTTTVTTKVTTRATTTATPPASTSTRATPSATRVTEGAVGDETATASRGPEATGHDSSSEVPGFGAVTAVVALFVAFRSANAE